ncbi:MAG: hypothetical protein JNM82_09305 [Rhodocyclaceae bacterium]|nr:hypothetical protein [Rhodocyclaceae bacterium]
MSMGGPLIAASRFPPRLFRIRRGIWLAIAVGLVAFLALVVWAAAVLFDRLWESGKSLAEGMPEGARTVVVQVEQALPGAREALGGLLPDLRTEPPPRDVSGTDIGPVTRYPGLPRSYWHRDGREITVRYEGSADYVAVLDHYAEGFAALGYARSVVSATPDGEVHDYRRNEERVRFQIVQLPRGKVKATIIAILP